MGSGLGNFLLCVEMLLFALAHRASFPTSEWDPAAKGYVAHRFVKPSGDARVHIDVPDDGEGGRSGEDDEDDEGSKGDEGTSAEPGVVGATLRGVGGVIAAAGQGMNVFDILTAFSDLSALQREAEALAAADRGDGDDEEEEEEEEGTQPHRQISAAEVTGLAMAEEEEAPLMPGIV